jgi:Trk K+ transport system NAD-binding subunit
VFGLGRYGGGIVRHLLLRKRRVIGVDFDPEALARWRLEEVPVLYGDAGDPDLFEHLPLTHVNWVVSTAPDLETSRVLLHHLRARGFTGRVAVACRTSDEGDVLRLEGADVLLRPYADAAEQAADAITSAMDRLGVVASAAPGLREVRLGSASKWAGRRISEVPLREEFGATVLAVSRGGRSFFNPGADFQLFPGDRVILTGEPGPLDQAIEYLARVDASVDAAQQDDFAVEEVALTAHPRWQGRSLAALELPARFGVTVLAMTGEREAMAAPDPHRPLTAEDHLVLAGTAAGLRQAREDGVTTPSPA